MPWTGTQSFSFSFQTSRSKRDGIFPPLCFLVKVFSNDFCKAGFACNMQVSSLGRFNTQRSYSPSPALRPDACNTQQPPALLPCCHKSSGEK